MNNEQLECSGVTIENSGILSLGFFDYKPWSVDCRLILTCRYQQGTNNCQLCDKLHHFFP
jgi:hypothetical protein